MKVKLIPVNPIKAMEVACGMISSIILRDDIDYRGKVAILGKISNGGDGTMPGYINCVADLINVKKLDKHHYVYKLANVDIIEPVKVGVVDGIIDYEYDFNIMPTFSNEHDQLVWEEQHYWKYIRGARKHYDDSWWIPEPCDFVYIQ